MKNFTLAVYLVLLGVIPSILVWLPFLLGLDAFFGIPIPNGGMQNVAANYDGPLYIVIAKSFYNLSYIATHYSFPLPLEYYAAHFPLYPLTIKLFSLPLGFPWGMLFATLFGSVLSTIYFYLLAKSVKTGKAALWLVVVFAIFPARWLIVRAVGSPEPLFVGLIMASVYHFNKKQYWLAGIFGALAQLTKSPAILLFVAYFCAIFLPKLKELATKRFAQWISTLNFRAYPILLIPSALLGLFYLYKVQFGDFLAYFNSGDNIHLFFPPFQIFNYSQPWVNTHWLEEIIFIYVFALLGLIALIKQKQTVFAWFVGIFTVTIFFVSHRDLMRYSLPILPYVVLAFHKELSSKEFKLILAIIALPIFLFSLAFISNNIMPIADWGPLL